MKKRVKKNNFIPVNVPKIFKQDKVNVKDCLDRGWISSEGNYVKKFEESFSKYINKKFPQSIPRMKNYNILQKHNIAMLFDILLVLKIYFS